MSGNSNSSYSPSLLPHTTNPWLLRGGDPSLYNAQLLLAATALFQHAAVFGLLFALRNFSAARALDLHFLTVVFASTFIAAPLLFLLDTHIDAPKLFFFLEHEAIEFLIAARVLLPSRLLYLYPGRLIALAWTALSAVSILIAFNPFHHHAADIVAWGAFASDSLLAASGIALMLRWRTHHRHFTPPSHVHGVLRRRVIAAEAFAGAGFALHGFSTVPVAPILTRILYHDLDPAWFAWAWVLVFGSAMGAVALAVPSAAIFFGSVNWCCWHDRKVLPGQAGWWKVESEDGSVGGA
ncbi:uncharacterized protein K452DRAFT_235752 [Aplosporella prunicola CBS 121167]|uniref:Uncharacterized protein n=1 Tax=Aplosporella prunicola CBS 121167 TaxID=1176127 RepID=A0A6A6B406_9PEZI|nr:uncharacterized protein K452DRAFT_235752 [Aplosporella prunicola CBS 121167]KAF2137471.1 hypothetical protein K452DRAFT_235752 [Aplosporella prunicola CBS 121167]